MCVNNGTDQKTICVLKTRYFYTKWDKGASECCANMSHCYQIYFGLIDLLLPLLYAAAAVQLPNHTYR